MTPALEVWRYIREFPGYSVGDEGHVRNDDTGRIMAMLVNQHGIGYVGLTKNCRQHKRSVTVLVATAFTPKLAQHRGTFDTPINLNGVRTDNRASNLMWRPRWFAVKYFHQFQSNERGFNVPIEEIGTGEQFKTSWDAALKYGLLDKEIFVATLNRTYVWPSYQRFRVL
jgi:hypothetical protein